METLLQQAQGMSLLGVYLFTAGGFLSIYLGIGAATTALTRRIFPALGWGARLGARQASSAQVRSEILHSLLSIAIFGGYGVVAVWLDRAGIAKLSWSASPLVVLGEVLLLTLWNELHFYLCHRLLHTKWLYRTVHIRHHRSVPATPWSTFSFHWAESALLGSVMVFVQLVHPLQAATALLFPVVSLLLNNLGHMNYDLVPGRPLWHPLSASRRHAQHHLRVHGNYGFLLPVFDQLFGTSFEDRTGSNRSGAP